MKPKCLFEIAKILYKKDYNNPRLVDLKTKFNLCINKRNNIIDTLLFFQQDLKAQEILFSLLNIKLKKWHYLAKPKSKYKERLKRVQKLDLTNLNKMFGRLVEISDCIEENCNNMYSNTTIDYSFNWYFNEDVYRQDPNVILFSTWFRLFDSNIDFSSNCNSNNFLIEENITLFKKETDEDIVSVINNHFNLVKKDNLKNILVENKLPENVIDYILNNLKDNLIYKDRLDYNPDRILNDDFDSFTSGSHKAEDKLVLQKLNEIKRLFKERNLGVNNFKYFVSDYHGEFTIRFLRNYIGG